MSRTQWIFSCKEMVFILLTDESWKKCFQRKGWQKTRKSFHETKMFYMAIIILTWCFSYNSYIWKKLLVASDFLSEFCQLFEIYSIYMPQYTSTLPLFVTSLTTHILKYFTSFIQLETRFKLSIPFSSYL